MQQQKYWSKNLKPSIKMGNSTLNRQTFLKIVKKSDDFEGI